MLFNRVLGVVELGVRAMSLLDKANTSSFGMPECSKVSSNVGNRQGILVTGHDLADLKDLLEQSENAGINPNVLVVYANAKILN